MKTWPNCVKRRDKQKAMYAWFSAISVFDSNPDPESDPKIQLNRQNDVELLSPQTLVDVEKTLKMQIGIDVPFAKRYKN